jgi:hypothetical protein
MDHWKLLTGVATTACIIAAGIAFSLNHQLRQARGEILTLTEDLAEARATAAQRPSRLRERAATAQRGDDRPRAIRPERIRRADTDDLSDNGPLPKKVMERAREQLRGEWEQRREQRVEAIRDALDQFIEERDLAPELADRAQDLWDAHREKLSGLRDLARDENADRAALREQFQAARGELQTGLVEIFGEEGAEELRERLPMGPFGGGFGGMWGR